MHSAQEPPLVQLKIKNCDCVLILVTAYYFSEHISCYNFIVILLIQYIKLLQIYWLIDSCVFGCQKTWGQFLNKNLGLLMNYIDLELNKTFFKPNFLMASFPHSQTASFITKLAIERIEQGTLCSTLCKEPLD